MSDYTTLRDMDPRHFVTVGQDLHKVATSQDTAFGDYEPDVLAPVRSGTIWKDAAQPDGVAVLEVQSRSYDTSSKLMSAASITSVTLGLELATAKVGLTTAIGQASDMQLTIDDDGQVAISDERWAEIHSPTHVGYPALESAKYRAEADRQGVQTLVDLAVTRATHADTECAKVLDMVGITELMLTPVADTALVAASRSDNQRAVEILDLATKLPEKLQHDANTELEKTRNKIDEFFDGVLVGLWHGLTGMWDTIFTIGDLPGLLIASGLGDGDARKQLDQLGKQLGSLDLGDFVDLADLKAGRYGEFVGQNLWWLVPIGKAGKLVKGSDVAKAPEKARGVLSYVDEHNGAAPKGYKGNKPYDNDPAKYAKPGQKPGEKLPETLPDGESITYTEYDVDPNLPGVPRNDERIVVGSDGSVRYTDDHFRTFTRIR